jgi:hypothetical protein
VTDGGSPQKGKREEGTEKNAQVSSKGTEEIGWDQEDAFRGWGYRRVGMDGGWPVRIRNQETMGHDVSIDPVSNLFRPDGTLPLRGEKQGNLVYPAQSIEQDDQLVEPTGGLQ